MRPQDVCILDRHPRNSGSKSACQHHDDKTCEAFPDFPSIILFKMVANCRICSDKSTKTAYHTPGLNCRVVVDGPKHFRYSFGFSSRQIRCKTRLVRCIIASKTHRRKTLKEKHHTHTHTHCNTIQHKLMPRIRLHNHTSWSSRMLT